MRFWVVPGMFLYTSASGHVDVLTRNTCCPVHVYISISNIVFSFKSKFCIWMEFKDFVCYLDGIQILKKKIYSLKTVFFKKTGFIVNDSQKAVSAYVMIFLIIIPTRVWNLSQNRQDLGIPTFVRYAHAIFCCGHSILFRTPWSNRFDFVINNHL